MTFEKPTALIVIDVQKGFDEPAMGARNNPDAEANILKLIQFWHAQQQPIIFIQHASTFADSPFHPSKPTYALKESMILKPEDTIFVKNVHSAFIGTDLEAHLRKNQIECVVVTGLTTDHCVSTTTRMASDLGFETVIIADATATFDRVGPDGTIHPAEEVHQLALVNLHLEFARVLKTDDILST